MRVYRLTDEPGGLPLAGAPLLRRTEAGFLPRPAAEIASLMKAAFGEAGDASRLASSLPAIARALNGGELARTAIAVVLTRTTELSADAARGLAAANDNLTKCDPNEPRTQADIVPGDIQVKTIQLAIPEYASPKQWRYLFSALRYGGERRVSIVITRIRQ